MAFKNLIPRRSHRAAAPRHRFETMRGFIEPMERFLESAHAFSGDVMPGFSLEETPTEIIVSARLPGYAPDELTVEATARSVTVRGGGLRASEGRKHGVIRRRSEARAFFQRTDLPAPVKPDGAKASFKGGILEIRMPRVTETVSRRIMID